MQENKIKENKARENKTENKTQEIYMQKVLMQIRCKKARPYIQKELEAHLEEQIADNEKTGMSREKAEREAVRDMGDPVETGIALDHVHRPQIAWKVILMVMVLSVVGVLIHYIIGKTGGFGIESSDNYMIHVGIGFLAMCAIYFMDYVWIARYAKIIAVALVFLYVSRILFGFSIMNGVSYLPIWIGGRLVNLNAIVLLYVPIYGGILYHYHGTGYKGVIKSFLWMMFPVVTVAYTGSNITAVILMICMMVSLTLAIMNDWFQVSKTKTFVGVWGITVLAPAITLAVMYMTNHLSAYEKMRIAEVYSRKGETNYIAITMHTLLKSDRIVGTSGEHVIQKLPGFNADYILSYLSSTYGILSGILVCSGIALLIFAVFRTAFRQKNQLGMIMCCGCGMVLLVNFMINILINMGMFPTTLTFLPFLSAGGNYLIVCYIMLGIVLSVYKNKNIYPKHIDIKKVTE